MDHEGEAIRQAPVLVGAVSVQLHRGRAEVRLKRDDIDSPIVVNSPIAFGRDGPRSRVRKSVEPLQSTASVVTIRLAVGAID
jgi:2-polyprenyl-6-methoxyphenol hydroxylase-like FAD-dependent oxidoreductase